MGKESTRAAAGFYADIEQLLRQRLKSDAAPPEARLKLIEVYYETGRAREFLHEVEALGAALDEARLADERIHIAGMGRELGLTGPRFGREAGLPQAAPPGGVPRARPLLQRRLGDDGRYREPFAALAADFAGAAVERPLADALDEALQRYAQRPTPLVEAAGLTRAMGGARILLKREDVAPAGARLLIAVAGQAWLARELGRTTLVTATVSGARGIATATVAAQLGLKSVIVMDRDDRARQSQAAWHMQLLGAELKVVTRRELHERDVRHAALEFWTQRPGERFPVMGLDAAPPPYGLLTRDIPAVVGRETRRQAQALTGRAPDLLVARGGDSGDAVGWFEPFLAQSTRLVCVAPSRDLGVKRKDELFGAAPGPSPDTLKRIAQADLAAREHAPVAREHGLLRASGRVEYVQAAPEAARQALLQTAAHEGVVPSIETAHAIGWACTEAARMKPEQTVIVMLAENGEAQLAELARLLDGHL